MRRRLGRPDPARLSVRLRPAVAALVAATACASLAPAAATAAPVFAAPVFAATVDALLRADGTFAPRSGARLDALRAGGVVEARAAVPWREVEPAPPRQGRHAYGWTRLDALVGGLAAGGLRWRPVLTAPPRWARRVADRAAFTGAVAARYGVRGTFWARHPATFRVPVQAVEIATGRDAAHSARLLVATADALRAADPAATLVAGGPPSRTGARFAAAMLAAEPTIPARVGAIGLAPAGASAPAVLRAVRALRRTLDAHGAVGMPIALAEATPPVAAARAGAYALTTDALVRSSCRVASFAPVVLPPGAPFTAYAGAIGRAAGATGPSLAVCDAAPGAAMAPPLPLRLRMRLGRRGGCIVARVSYRGHALAGARVAFADGRTTTTDGKGETGRCGLRPSVLRATATVGRAAASPTGLVATR